MATKRGDKSKHELVTLANIPIKKKEEEFIERLVLPSDTLQGIALLYNTTVAEIKRLNHLQKETDLHGRRIVKVPSRGILVDLTEAAAVPIHIHPGPSQRLLDGEESDEEESTNGQEYLNNVDNVLQEIKEKAETAAANSILLQASESQELLSQIRSKNDEIAWWKIAIPCFAVLIILPYLIYLYLEEHLHPEHPHHNATVNALAHLQSHYH